MLIVWFCLLFLALACFSLKITPEENAQLKKICGANYLGDVKRSKRSMDGNVFPRYQPHSTKDHSVRGKLRLQGGRSLSQNEYPWIADLHYNRHLCFGSVISDRHILTAAHCVISIADPDVYPPEECRKKGHINKRNKLEGNWTILVGSGCTDPEVCNSGWLKPDKIYFHEDFNECTVEHDLAIFEFKDNIPHSMASPICMPGRNHSIFHTLKVGGFGSAEAGASRKRYGTIDVDFIGTEGNFVVVEASPEQGICQGDSGGPLFQTDGEEKNVQIGVDSYGGSCRTSLKPNELRIDFTTDVRKYLDWICEKTGVCPIDEDIKESTPSNIWEHLRN
ncbi:Peptidase S1 domain-containing protein [Trichostrongylus colubriformis]|uniref:Peptidase S1 domain-containing protein n=1 Tax=Trichostrongylus colubriformis TaxID=6319 RepID=A0AAN8F3H7_TRICO